MRYAFAGTDAAWRVLHFKRSRGFSTKPSVGYAQYLFCIPSSPCMGCISWARKQIAKRNGLATQ